MGLSAVVVSVLTLVVNIFSPAPRPDDAQILEESAAAENTESRLREMHGIAAHAADIETGLSEGGIENPVAHDRTTQERGVLDLTQPAPSNFGVQAETEMHQIPPSGTNHGRQNISPAAPLPQGALEDSGSLSVEEAETQRQAVKVAYCSMTISAPGVLAYIFGINQIGQDHRLALDICALLLAAAFALAAFLIGLAGFRWPISYRSEIFSTFKYMILGAMVLAILGSSYIFLKLLTLVTTAPILLLLFLVLR